MPKAMFLMKRLPGITPEQFREHYEEKHIPLALRYIGHLLKDYRRNYPTRVIVDPAGAALSGADAAPFCDYDCITEMWVAHEEDLAHMAQIFSDPAIAPILAEDESKFLESKEAVMILTEEVCTNLPAIRG